MRKAKLFDQRFHRFRQHRTHLYVPFFVAHSLIFIRRAEMLVSGILHSFYSCTNNYYILHERINSQCPLHCIPIISLDLVMCVCVCSWWHNAIVIRLIHRLTAPNTHLPLPFFVFGNGFWYFHHIFVSIERCNQLGNIDTTADSVLTCLFIVIW